MHDFSQVVVLSYSVKHKTYLVTSRTKLDQLLETNIQTQMSRLTS